MNAALAIAEQMLIDRLMSNKAPLTGESKIKFTLLAFAGSMALGTIGFLLYAMYLWLNANYDPTVVMFSMAGVTSLLSLLAINLFFALSAYKKRKIKEKRDEIIKIAEDTLTIANHKLSEPIKESPLTATLIASLAGFIAGEKLI